MNPIVDVGQASKDEHPILLVLNRNSQKAHVFCYCFRDGHHKDLQFSPVVS